jgi:hypothetical protein
LAPRRILEAILVLATPIGFVPHETTPRPVLSKGVATLWANVIIGFGRRSTHFATMSVDAMNRLDLVRWILRSGDRPSFAIGACLYRYSNVSTRIAGLRGKANFVREHAVLSFVANA